VVWLSAQLAVAQFGPHSWTGTAHNAVDFHVQFF